MGRVTEVAGNPIAIEDGDSSLVYFSEDLRNNNPGGWEFWTLVGATGSVTGRCRPGSDPGERFRRMEGEDGYEDAWEIALSAILVRPANEEKILGWLNSHKDDAVFAESCTIGARTAHVVAGPDGFQLE
jgi:hypothetical protein